MSIGDDLKFEEGTEKESDENHVYMNKLFNSFKEVKERPNWGKVCPKMDKPVNKKENLKKVLEAIKAYKNKHSSREGVDIQDSDRIPDRFQPKIIEAMKRDMEEYNKALKKYDEFKDFNTKYATIQKGIMEKNIEVFPDAINYFSPFNGIFPFQVPVAFEFEKVLGLIASKVEAKIPMNLNISPDYEYMHLVTVTKSKISPEEKLINELIFYSSFVLRVSRELFNLLPVDIIYITINKEQISWITDEGEYEPIFSIVIDKKNLLDIDFEKEDNAVKLLLNFDHVFNQDEEGFHPIMPLEITF